MLKATFKPVTHYDLEARRYLTRFEPCMKFVPEDEDVCEPEDDEPSYCPCCNGSGEGQYDGSRCSACGGKGVEREEDDRRDYEREDKE